MYPRVIPSAANDLAIGDEGCQASPDACRTPDSHPRRTDAFAEHSSSGLHILSPLRMTRKVKAIREAGVEEIAATPGFTRSLAEKVLARI